jgi:hypothetical protein
MQNTIYKKSSGFLPKEAKLQIMIGSGQSWKPFASVTLNLSDYISSPVTEKEFILKECNEKNLKLVISVLTRYSEKNDELDKDELLNRLNNTKNELAALENKMDEVLEEKNLAFNELSCLKQDFEEVKEKSEESTIKEEK